MAEWTAAKIARLRKLDAANLSMAEIAAKLGVTRGAVIGKLNRLKPPSAHAPRRIRHTSLRKRVIQPRPAAPPPVVVAIKPEPEPAHPCALLDLGEHSCRWPLWDHQTRKPSYFFCGAWAPGALAYQPYCAKHTGMAYQPWRRPERPRIFRFR